MNHEQMQLEDFHRKFDFPVYKVLTEEPDELLGGVRRLAIAEEWLKINHAKQEFALRRQAAGDERSYREFLILEEALEAVVAMIKKDEVLLADALADLMYVVIGTAVTYNIPLGEVFQEVHRANMSKQRSSADPRMRVRPADYVPPDIEGAIERGRS